MSSPIPGNPGPPAYVPPVLGGRVDPVASSPAKTNVLSIAAFISSFFISVAGVVLGHMALNQIKTTHEQGRSLAIAGLIIGYAGIVLGIVFVFIFIVVVATTAGSTGELGYDQY